MGTFGLEIKTLVCKVPSLKVFHVTSITGRLSKVLEGSSVRESIDNFDRTATLIFRDSAKSTNSKTLPTKCPYQRKIDKKSSAQMERSQVKVVKDLVTQQVMCDNLNPLPILLLYVYEKTARVMHIWKSELVCPNHTF